MCGKLSWSIAILAVSMIEIGLVASKEKHPDNLAKFIYYDAEGNQQIGQCSEEMIFNETIRDCVKYKKEKSKNKRQVGLVGMPCNENIDCLTINGGAYCDPTKRCDCLANAVNIGGFCWAKINPGETGCQFNEQCSSVWPGSTCTSANACQCANGLKPSPTNDGPVCITAGACPTNGLFSKSKNQDGSAHSCSPGLFLTCPLNDYDCICTPPDMANGLVTCEGVVNFCCPTRALACIMPKEEGVSSGGLPRNKYYYNSATNECETLSFNGAGGNANNFETKQQCESYCKTACRRGRPEYNDDGNTANPLLINTPKTCTLTSNTCTAPNYQCPPSTGSSSTTTYCCPAPTFVCGPNGGQALQIGPIVVPDVGAVQPLVSPRTRYFFDQPTQTCRPFQYLGAGGNFNNFATIAECQSYCAASVCPAGDLLRDVNGARIVCGTGVSCPTRYECTNGNCCPSREFVCSLPMAPGSCLQYSKKWWFNPDTRTCQEFTYNGCQGNFNNFDSYSACQTYCGPSPATPRCLQGSAAKDSSNSYYVCSGTSTSTISPCPIGYYCYFDGFRYGCCPTKTQTCEVDTVTTSGTGTPCITPVSRWYYNTTSRKCDQFTYNGCDGSSNNFGTQLDCQDYCGVGGCKEAGGEPFKETTGLYRVCTTNGNECPAGFTCSQVSTGTNMVNLYCCPTRDQVCRLPQDQGSTCGISTLTRYFFNSVTRACESFVYRGCGGNRNNFASATQCQNYCNSAACAGGQIAQTDTTTNRLTTCQITSSTSSGCPMGWNCVFSNLLNQGVCCGSNAPPDTCPSGQSAYLDSFSLAPMQCLQNVDGQCPMTPTRYFCQPSFTQGSSFCCATTVVQCSRGGNVGIDSFNNPQQCTPNVPQNCQIGYECQAVTFLNVNVTSATGYCCGTPNPCGTGYNTLFVNNQPATCDASSTTNTCSNPSYSCMRTVGSVGYCCILAASAVNPCAASGKFPYYIQNAPTVCVPGQGNTGAGCPFGYTCDIYSAVNTYYCCTSQGGTLPPGGQNVCPSGSPLATSCTTSATCGVGYTCKPGTATPVCCPSPATACSQPQMTGQSCATGSPGQRYSYNPSTRSCTAFTYLGCGGNTNNFASAQACEEFCLAGLCARGRPQYVTGQSVQACTMNGNCNPGYECSLSQFGGGGSICCQMPTTLCALLADAGRPCSGLATTAMQMFYFNSASRTCMQFAYNGCGGNANSFETLALCQLTCGTGGGTNFCPAGRSPQMNLATGQPTLCNMGGTGPACGSGYTCAYSSTGANYYCCTPPGGSGGGCSVGSPYLYPGTSLPLACTIGGPSCPPNYTCRQSSSGINFVCCSVTQVGATPLIRCTGQQYCQNRMKSNKAVCNMSSFTCVCGANEIYSTSINGCVPKTII